MSTVIVADHRRPPDDDKSPIVVVHPHRRSTIVAAHHRHHSFKLIVDDDPDPRRSTIGRRTSYIVVDDHHHLARRSFDVVGDDAHHHHHRRPSTIGRRSFNVVVDDAHHHHRPSTIGRRSFNVVVDDAHHDHHHRPSKIGAPLSSPSRTSFSFVGDDDDGSSLVLPDRRGLAPMRFSTSTPSRTSFMMTPSSFRTEGFVIGDNGMTSSSSRRSMFAVDRSTTALSDLVLIGLGGRGASASIMKVLRIDQIGVYALKSIDVCSQQKRRQLVKELEIFADIAKCPNIVQFHGAYYEKGHALLVLEYMNGGSLQSFIEQHGKQPPCIVIAIAKQMMTALAHLHARHLLHRDVKPGNVLVSRRGRIKLADFGISESVRSSSPFLEGFVGTQLYMSPERLAGDEYGVTADIWSAGLVVAFVALGRHPFDGDEGFFGIVHQIQTIEVSEVAGIPDGVRSLLRCCLALDPEQRWTAAQLLEHPALRDVDGEGEWHMGIKHDYEEKHAIAAILADRVYGGESADTIDGAVDESDLEDLARTLDITTRSMKDAILNIFSKATTRQH